MRVKRDEIVRRHDRKYGLYCPEGNKEKLKMAEGKGPEVGIEV